MSDTSKGYAHPELLVTPAELSREMAEAPDRLLLLDVRPAHRFAAGHLPHAVHLDLFGLSLIDFAGNALTRFDQSVTLAANASRVYMTFPERDILKGADPSKVVLVTELEIEGAASATKTRNLLYRGLADLREILESWGIRPGGRSQ